MAAMGFLEGPNWLIVREMRLQRATRNWFWGMSCGKKVNQGFEGQQGKSEVQVKPLE